MAKIKLGLDKLTPDQKVANGTTVITAMTGNANFTTPNPTLASGTTAKGALQTAINDYNTWLAQGAAKLTARDAAEAAFDGFMTQLAAYVENVSGGDQAKIESGGLSVRATAAPVGPLGQVMDLVVTAGDHASTLDVAWDPLRGAGSYEVHTSAEPVTGTSWTFSAVSVKSSTTLGGFTSGSKVWVRVRGVGAKNQTGEWSDPAVKVVP